MCPSELNKMDVYLVLREPAKSALVGLVIGLPIVALILWLMGSAGSWWWLWAWGVWMGFNLLVLVLFPTVIAPMFNKFKPLEDEALRARVTARARRVAGQGRPGLGAWCSSGAM